MDLSIEYFENIQVSGPSYGVGLSVSGVDPDEIIGQFDAEEILKVVEIKDVVKYHDHHELIEAIGDIDKFVEVFGRAAILDHLDVNENEEED